MQGSGLDGSMRGTPCPALGSAWPWVCCDAGRKEGGGADNSATFASRTITYCKTSGSPGPRSAARPTSRSCLSCFGSREEVQNGHPRATRHVDSQHPGSSAVARRSDNQNNTIAWRLRAAGSSFFWAMQLLPYQRREAMYALYSFCREVDDVIDGDALRPLKDVLLSDWRSEILHPLR